MTDVSEAERRQYQGIYNRYKSKRKQFKPYLKDNGSE